MLTSLVLPSHFSCRVSSRGRGNIGSTFFFGFVLRCAMLHKITFILCSDLTFSPQPRDFQEEDQQDGWNVQESAGEKSRVVHMVCHQSTFPSQNFSTDIARSLHARRRPRGGLSETFCKTFFSTPHRDFILSSTLGRAYKPPTACSKAWEKRRSRYLGDKFDNFDFTFVFIFYFCFHFLLFRSKVIMQVCSPSGVTQSSVDRTPRAYETWSDGKPRPPVRIRMFD